MKAIKRLLQYKMFRVIFTILIIMFILLEIKVSFILMNSPSIFGLIFGFMLLAGALGFPIEYLVRKFKSKTKE